MPLRLPIFPLGVVLFPGTPLPLHIFEPRYRRMLADCLAGDRRFGIIPTGTTAELPERGTVGCTAVVRVNQELPDGRSNIIVLGAERFVLAGAVDDPAPYHVALVEPFEDDPGSDPPPESSDHLRELFAGYHLVLRQLQDTEPDDPELPGDSVALSFHVSAAVDADLGVKQRLLAERSTARRVEALLMLLPILTARAESALKVHRRGHTNGRGGTRPDILLES
jgi:Lon protease-like protein